MVSKPIKKTPTKSIKDHRNHQRRKITPVKINDFSAATSTVIHQINRSIFTCRRRLEKFLSKLARISTTPLRNKKRHHAIKLLTKLPEIRNHETKAPIRSLFFENRLPPLKDCTKKTIFLDLDETLVHSTADMPPEKFDFVVRPKIDGEFFDFYVLKRPGLDNFLGSLAEKFEIIVFTAGLEEYASLVLDAIDCKSMISYRLYRDSCTEVDGMFVKDLSQMGRDLSRVVIVDDNPNAYSFQPENAILVKPFMDDVEDRELEKLIMFSEGCHCFDDMRDAVENYVSAID